MTDLAFLTREIGGQALGDFLTAAANRFVHLDRMPWQKAYQWVTDRADTGDPLIIAAAGQIWVRRNDVDPDEAPARRILITERLTTQAAIHVIYLDLDADAHDTGAGNQTLMPQASRKDASTGDELLLSFLDLYELQSWRPAEILLPTTTTTARACDQCAGRPAEILEKVSGDDPNARATAQQRATQLGQDAHPHAHSTGDFTVVRPINGLPS
ncbi:hypothetical protein AB0H07_39040 [Streptomyces sp. NPDC021354]|uniref:hypothetical protein n=1 Tax=Streptomyces sp. NPDC021354 TaxID=3154793 RepID=UPI0034012EDC